MNKICFSLCICDWIPCAKFKKGKSCVFGATIMCHVKVYIHAQLRYSVFDWDSAKLARLLSFPALFRDWAGCCARLMTEQPIGCFDLALWAEVLLNNNGRSVVFRFIEELRIVFIYFAFSILNVWNKKKLFHGILF